MLVECRCKHKVISKSMADKQKQEKCGNVLKEVTCNFFYFFSLLHKP